MCESERVEIEKASACLCFVHMFVIDNSLYKTRQQLDNGNL